MKKMELMVGQKIRGYGLLNEFGEFDFIPEQTGIRQGEIKLVKTNENYTLSETKKKLIVHLRIEKCKDRFTLLKNFSAIMSSIFNDLRDYEF